MSEEKNKPVKTFSEGGLKVKVWLNNSIEHGNFYTISVEKSYKDKDDNWKTCTSFGRKEAPIMASLLLQAHAYLVGVDA